MSSTLLEYLVKTINWPSLQYGDAIFKKHIHSLKSALLENYIPFPSELGIIVDSELVEVNALDNNRINKLSQEEHFRERIYNTIARIEEDYERRIERKKLSENDKPINLQKQRRQVPKEKLSKKNIKKKVINFEFDPTPRLFCKETNEEYPFTHIDQKCTILIKAAFSESTEKNSDGWLDALSFATATESKKSGECESFKRRSLPDAGKGINENFQKKFKIDEGLFQLDYPNKRVKLIENPQKFRLKKTGIPKRQQ